MEVIRDDGLGQDCKSLLNAKNFKVFYRLVRADPLLMQAIDVIKQMHLHFEYKTFKV